MSRRRASSRGGVPRRKALVAALALAVAGVVLFPALSRATTGPTVTTSLPSNVMSTSATLNGTINTNNPDTGAVYDYAFSWGTNASNLTNSNGGTVGGGTADQEVSLPISGLNPGTTYYFQLCATNEGDSGDADCSTPIDQFTTAPAAPDVSVGSGTPSTTTTGATLSGTVNPNGDTTSYVFVYGTSSSGGCGGYSSQSGGGSAGSGTSVTGVQDTISGLHANTKYFFRLSATNGEGTTCSAQGSFATPNVPAATTDNPSALGTHSVTLNGSVTPSGSKVTSVGFTYCTGCSSASGGVFAAASPSPGSGSSPVGVSANLSGLASGAQFHYMLCATNAYGTTCSPDQTFTTDTPPTAGLTADKTSGPVPLTVNFDGSGSSDPDVNDAVVSYTFSFGDGSGSVTQPSPTIQHVYTKVCSPSPCSATLIVTDKEGATSSAATVLIHANQNVPPTAALTATPTSGTTPLAVSFDGSGSSDADGSVASWSLDFGDQNSATGTGAVPSAIAHTYTSACSCTAKLTVTDSSGAQSSKSVSIAVNPPPSITIGNVSQNEGNSGTTNFVFPVTLSSLSTHDVAVTYKTSDGTATAGSDYTATAGTLQIPAGTDCTSSNPACAIKVPVSGDAINEPNETFTVTLSNPVAATFPGAVTTVTATGTILNDDQAPELIIEKGATQEGNAGSKVAGAESWSSGGNLQLADSSGFLPYYGPHQFYVSTPGAAPLSGPFTYHGIDAATNTLTDVTPGGSVSAGQIAFQPRSVVIPVLLCDPQKTAANSGTCVQTTSGFDTTVNYETFDGVSQTTFIPVIKGQDYVYSSGTLTIKAGQNGASLSIETIPNTTPESSIPGNDLVRWFTVHLTSPANATIAPGGGGLGQGTILDDDAPNPPKATTGAASSIGTDNATVSATVNPNGAATGAYVEYGTTDMYGHQTATQSLAAGTGDQTLTFSLSGLAPGTTYHYHVVATHGADGATGYGADSTFTTDLPPTAVLGANKTKGSVPLSVTFNGSGSSDPDGSVASWTLSFGDGTPPTSGSGPVPSAIGHTYGSVCSCTAILTVTDNQGIQSKAASIVITVGPGGGGGGGQPPPPPKLSTYITTVLGPTSARIVFPVDPKGAATRAWVEYGTTAAYGTMSSVQTIPAGSAQAVRVTLTGLSPQTVYHYAVFAAHTSDTGAAHSQDLKFSTPKLHYMSVTLKSKSVTANATGKVSLALYCSGNVLLACKGKAQLRLGRLGAGSTSFLVPRAHRKLVSVRLKPTVWKRLLAGHGLRLGVSLSVQTGGQGVDLGTNKIMVLPPKTRRS